MRPADEQATSFLAAAASTTCLSKPPGPVLAEFPRVQTACPAARTWTDGPSPQADRGFSTPNHFSLPASRTLRSASPSVSRHDRGGHHDGSITTFCVVGCLSRWYIRCIYIYTYLGYLRVHRETLGRRRKMTLRPPTFLISPAKDAALAGTVLLLLR